MLVVDDRRDMRYLLQTYLEEAGADVTTVSNGEAALQLHAGQQAFETIVLDMQMPELDGYQTAQLLRQHGYRGKLIALTANAMRGDRDRCLEAGCDEYLSKPVDRLRLFQMIAGVRPPTPQHQHQARERSGAVDGPRVLVVDDNSDAADVLARLLERSGFEVRTASTGAEAVLCAAEFVPAAVVLDLGLPDMDGYAVLEHLKASASLRSTLFIALTGRGAEHDMQRTRRAGFDHHLVKPPDLRELQRLLRGPLPVEPH